MASPQGNMALGGLLGPFRNSRGRGQANSSLFLSLPRADPLPHTGVRSRLSPGTQRAARKLSQKASGCGRPVHDRGEGGAARRRHAPAAGVVVISGGNIRHHALSNAWLHSRRRGQAGGQGSDSTPRKPRALEAGRGPGALPKTEAGLVRRAGPLPVSSWIGPRVAGAPAPHWPSA